MRRVAVVGSGIAGLAAAYFLSRHHRVWLFERDSRLGGHTHTVVAESAQGPVALDTGFLVHNVRTYPRLVRLFDELAIATQPSDMCFSVSCPRTGLEYSSRGARGFFAQKRNLGSRRHLVLLGEILRFNRLAPRALARGDGAAGTIGDFLAEHRFSEVFRRFYLFPMASAIWSTSMAGIEAFPVVTLLRFLDNHGLLSVGGQPIWRVVQGGSHTYIPKLIAPLGDRVHLGVTITGIRRDPCTVTISFRDRRPATFDDVVLACHGDQVLPLLEDPTDAERDVFAQFTTTTNEACLHTDAAVRPRRPGARAAWNYRLGTSDVAPPTVSYDLNRLQSLTTPEAYSVTLNPAEAAIRSDQVLKRMIYEHPLYTHAAIRAQTRWAEVSGVRRTHYAGAYWFYGFHEDGLRSAQRVAHAMGVTW
jgi:predicted NAD/FAD-binding protein